MYEYQGLPFLRVGNVWFVPARRCDVDRYNGAKPGDYALPARRVGHHWVTPFVSRRFITEYAARRNLSVRVQ